MQPLDPSEPLYPVRPTEPPCQYFLKHGTCKFGQLCKFHHPTGAPLGDGADRCLPAGGLINVMTTSTSVQVLPQRPTDPSCIYFLKNGKCKYGATCKFHHPIDAINGNHQMNTGPSHHPRNGANSAGPFFDGYPQVEHSMAYATTANAAYVQSQRLQPITERMKPQQPTHILLPDGQIAIILDPCGLQNANEVKAQVQPKFYISKPNESIGTLKSLDQKNISADLSPMLTATTNSMSNLTVDSSLDLLGTSVSYQRQPQVTPSRSPPKSRSGGSLSAYGSLDSGLHLQDDRVRPMAYQGQRQALPSHLPSKSGSGDSLSAHGSTESCAIIEEDFIRKGSGQFSQPTPTDLVQTSAFEYSAWPMDEGVEQSNQQINVGGFEQGYHNWPSNAYDIQAGRNYDSRQVNLSPQGKLHGNRPQCQATPDDERDLSMMTSALLTMMDHDPTSEKESSPATAPSNIHHHNESYHSQIEPKFHKNASHVRAPPGMTNTQASYYVGSFDPLGLNQDSTNASA